MLHFYYWTTGYLYGKIPSAIGPLAIPMLHLYLPLTNWISLWYTTLSYWPTGYLNWTLLSSTGPLAIPLLHYPLLLDHAFPMVHYYLLLAYCLSVWYTTLSTGYLYGTLLSSTGPLNISIVHYLSYWPTSYPYGTLHYPISPLAIPMVHYYLLLA